MDSRKLAIAGIEMTCPICSHDEFSRQQFLVSAGVEARVVLSPTGKRSLTHRVKDGEVPVAESCARCDYVLLFVRPPDDHS
ncbi:MAG: hypothetical protein ACT452_11025 [Microthrixaceae bacterium]